MDSHLNALVLVVIGDFYADMSVGPVVREVGLMCLAGHGVYTPFTR